MNNNAEGIREMKVEYRSAKGKGVARKLRKSGRIPGVFYGSKSEAVALSVDPDDLVDALDTPKLKNTIIVLTADHEGLDGKKAMVKEIQRHPLTREFLHVDFMEVYSDRVVRTVIPITVKGHAIGVDLGGTLDQHLRHLEIKCVPEKIPVEIVIDVAKMKIGDALKTSELEVGEGIEILGEMQASVVSIAAPRVAERAAGVGAEGEEGEAEGEAAEDKKAEEN